MIIVNTHEAKTKLSYLLHEIESHKEVVRIRRNGKPVADIIPIKYINPLKQHKEVKEIEINYNPVSTLSEDEWPEDAG